MPVPVRTSPSAANRCSLGAGEILFVGDLDVAGLAGEDADLQAGPFGERGVVGEIVAALRRRRGGAPSSRSGEGKTLRRLHQAQRWRGRASRRRRPSGVDRLHRIGDRQRRDRRAGSVGGRDRARDQGGAGEGPRRVMDQNDVGLAGGERLEAGAHRSLPGGAAECRRQQVETNPAAEDRTIDIVGLNNRLYEADLWMFYEHGQRAAGACFRRQSAGIAWAYRAPARIPRPAATTTAATPAMLIEAPRFAALD